MGAHSGAGRTCRECGEVFTLTEGELGFFAQRGLELPRRCAPCRLARKAARLSGVDLDTRPVLSGWNGRRPVEKLRRGHVRARG